MYIKEKTLEIRKNLMECYKSSMQIEELLYSIDDTRKIQQCSKCMAFCFTNVIFCRCNPERFSCEIHIKEVLLNVSYYLGFPMQLQLFCPASAFFRRRLSANTKQGE